METVLEALTCEGGRHLVGIVGDSGSGKTTIASEVVRSPKARQTFPDGILWLPVNKGDDGHLAESVLLALARMVHRDVLGGVGRLPEEPSDCAAYIKQQMERGHRGKGLKCLVVADNVGEKEVVSKLLETGMWVLLSTRDEQLVTDAEGSAVFVDMLSTAEAESVLRRAAELPLDVRLPDHSIDLIELCGRVAIHVAFVGRWSTVRGRQDRRAWSDAADKVRLEMAKVASAPAGDDVVGLGEKRRMAILRAGFEDLAIGSDDERVQRLYLSLAVLPDGHAFTLKDAAVLLFSSPNADDEASVAEVLDVLERWTAVRPSEGGAYRMHDAHSSFARQKLANRGDVCWPALQRWVNSISAFDALYSFDRYTLKRLWQAVKDVGGDDWDITRPYVEALTEMDDSDPLAARHNAKAVARFQVALEDWDGASTTWLRLLQAEVKHRGADHPYVLNAYEHLADLAEQAGNSEQASEWREKVRVELSAALATMKSQLDGSGGNCFDLVGLSCLATTILRVKPEDGAEAEHLLRRSLSIREAKLEQDRLSPPGVT
eukprot:g20467.t1